jgi:hypothetical protein
MFFSLDFTTMWAHSIRANCGCLKTKAQEQRAEHANCWEKEAVILFLNRTRRSCELPSTTDKMLGLAKVLRMFQKKQQR